jgi:hypothetical protein
MYKEELENEGIVNVEKTIEKHFSSWFKKHVSFKFISSASIIDLFSPWIFLCLQIASLRFVDGEDIDDDLYALACEPDLRVRIFSACLVDGVRYHTIDRERNRRTQNSGVMVEGTHNNECIDFYGCLKEII